MRRRHSACRVETHLRPLSRELGKSAPMSQGAADTSGSPPFGQSLAGLTACTRSPASPRSVKDRLKPMLQAGCRLCIGEWLVENSSLAITSLTAQTNSGHGSRQKLRIRRLRRRQACWVEDIQLVQPSASHRIIGEDYPRSALALRCQDFYPTENFTISLFQPRPRHRR